MSVQGEAGKPKLPRKGKVREAKAVSRKARLTPPVARE